jgi:hypothetical protein
MESEPIEPHLLGALHVLSIQLPKRQSSLLVGGASSSVKQAQFQSENFYLPGLSAKGGFSAITGTGMSMLLLILPSGMTLLWLNSRLLI